MVTAIIGIISALAVPKYERYKRKSQQAEVKLKLASIYTLEKTFYSEYSAYAPDFNAIGFSPEGAKQWYMCGWGGAPFTSSITGYTGGFTNAWISFNVPVESTFATNTTGCATAVDINAAPLNQNDPQGITAMCVGYLANFHPCDYWTIDNYKVLKNTINGI